MEIALSWSEDAKGAEQRGFVCAEGCNVSLWNRTSTAEIRLLTSSVLTAQKRPNTSLFIVLGMPGRSGANTDIEIVMMV